MSNMHGNQPNGSDSEDHKEERLLMSFWQAEADAAGSLPVSAKTKRALQELMRSHGVTHMPAIDALEVYEDPESMSATSAPAPGRVALFQLMGAMRDGVALAARGLRDFMDAMNSPQPAPMGSAMRLVPAQDEAGPTHASAAAVSRPALGWHIAALSFRPSNRQVTLVIRTHLASSDPLHVAVLGWSDDAVAQLSRANAGDHAWVPQPHDVACLWEGDLQGDQNEHRIAFKIPDGWDLNPEFEAQLRTLLVNDGAGALVASLKIGAPG